jgi:hypothetical protein
MQLCELVASRRRRKRIVGIRSFIDESAAVTDEITGMDEIADTPES